MRKIDKCPEKYIRKITEIIEPNLMKALVAPELNRIKI